jgi:hypothetical protein
MKPILLIFALSINFLCFSQDIQVAVNNIYIETADNKEIITTILCEAKTIEIDTLNRVRLLFA